MKTVSVGGFDALTDAVRGNHKLRTVEVLDIENTETQTPESNLDDDVDFDFDFDFDF